MRAKQWLLCLIPPFPVRNLGHGDCAPGGGVTRVTSEEVGLGCVCTLILEDVGYQLLTSSKSKAASLARSLLARSPDVR